MSRHTDLVLSKSYKKHRREETKLENGEVANVFLSDTSGRRMKAKLSRAGDGDTGLSPKTPNRKDLHPQPHMSQRESVLA